MNAASVSAPAPLAAPMDRLIRHVDFSTDRCVARYVSVGEGVPAMWLLPADRLGDAAQRRETLTEPDALQFFRSRGKPPGFAWRPDPLIQLAVCRQGSPRPSVRQTGSTMRHNNVLSKLSRVAIEHRRSDHGGTVITDLRNEAWAFSVRHRLVMRDDRGYVVSHARVTNDGDTPLRIEFLSSFCLGGLSPFAEDDASGRLLLHRFRSSWAAEGRLVSDTLEDLQLERSWLGPNPPVMRFGALGSRPATGFFPMLAVEDTAAGVTWGVALDAPASWQMQLQRVDDTVSVDGGIADREFGQWFVDLAPGESLDAPAAALSVVSGGVDEAMGELVRWQEDRRPFRAAEEGLPVCFNEFCTTWANPTHDRCIKLADAAKGLAKYFVIDAGWFISAKDGEKSGNVHGDWVPSPEHFAGDMKVVADAIRQRGLVPGLWFEYENAGKDSLAYDRLAQHMLKRDGMAIDTGLRTFFDMRDPKALEHLRRCVIDQLRNGGYGYLKIDYNASVGVTCDGPEPSGGESLRQQALASQWFVEEIGRALPDLVIENCASGGHRLEPALQARCSLGSFSDAHENPEIPIIAANLQRLIAPSQSLIWATLRETDNATRLIYSMAATFLGRVCLSGDIDRLDADQRGIVEQAIALYQRGTGVILDGDSKRFGPPVASMRHPAGWQAVTRVARDSSAALVVAHAFGNPPTEPVVCDPDRGPWRVAASLGSGIGINDGRIKVRFAEPFSAAVALLEPGK
ncbi:MAG: glycoside hydrolase family 36 protein [Planctomycetota bacterium]